MTDPRPGEADAQGGSVRGALDGWTVLDLGTRPGCSACSTLLLQAGARVFALEQDIDPAARPARMAGKSSLALNAERPGDLRLFDDLVTRVDVLVLSSDQPTPLIERALRHRHPTIILCDITAFGASGPCQGQKLPDFLPDALLQALCGVSSVTGTAHGAPTISDVPMLELSAALYGAAGVLAAARVLRMGGPAQDVEAALYDCGINLLVTFLPLHFGDRVPGRVGNRHPMSAPWNAFRATDGWIMLCSAKDEHWRKLCGVIGRPALAEDSRFARIAGRIQHCDAVDGAVTDWTSAHSVEACVAALSEAGLACGPILTMAGLDDEPNLQHRRTVLTRRDPVSGRMAKIPNTLLRTVPSLDQPALEVPSIDDGRTAAASIRDRTVTPSQSAPIQPLHAIRVLEIGQYTTAPHAARQLGLLGAEIIKIEPLDGEASRAWPPHQDGQGLFFTMNNSGKQSLALDLRRGADRDVFRTLLASSDILIENLKPGSLDRLGFGRAAQVAINPRLIYCAISGFGAHSVYPGRAAFDTVVQAMSGMMALTRAEDGPVKLGPSVADISGGMFGLFAALVLLEIRDRTGQALAIDISMQDVGAWMTHLCWNGAPLPPHTIIACEGGEVAAAASPADTARALGPLQDGTAPREAVLAKLADAGIAAVPAHDISSAAGGPQTLARQLIRTVADGEGKSWPLLAMPYRLSALPPPSPIPIGPLGEANRRFFPEP